MSRLSQLFFVIFFAVIIIATAVSLCVYLIARDYYLIVDVPCDPAFESCFIYECDPAVDGECPADRSEWTQYYKLLRVLARSVPDCDPADTECPAPACAAGEDCTEIMCSPGSIGPDEQCAGPSVSR